MRTGDGPLAAEWGYGFPEEWGSQSLPLWSRIQYALWNTAGRISTQVLNLPPRHYQRLRVEMNRRGREEPIRR